MQDCVWRQGWRPQNPEWGIYHLQAVCHLDKKFNFSDIRFIYLRNVVGIKYGTVLRVWHSACDIEVFPSGSYCSVFSGRERSKERKATVWSWGDGLVRALQKSRTSRREVLLFASFFSFLVGG